MAIKGQALTDFVAEFTYGVTRESKKGSSEIKTPEQFDSGDISIWKLFIDSSSNQHGCGVGLIL